MSFLRLHSSGLAIFYSSIDRKTNFSSVFLSICRRLDRTLVLAALTNSRQMSLSCGLAEVRLQICRPVDMTELFAKVWLFDSSRMFLARHISCFFTEQIPWTDIGLGIGLPGCAALFAVLVYFRRRMQAQKNEDEAWVAKWSELKIHRKEEEKEKDKDKKKLAQLAAAKKDPETVSGASLGASMGGTSEKTFCQQFFTKYF